MAMIEAMALGGSRTFIRAAAVRYVQAYRRLSRPMTMVVTGDTEDAFVIVDGDVEVIARLVDEALRPSKR